MTILKIFLICILVFMLFIALMNVGLIIRKKRFVMPDKKRRELLGQKCGFCGGDQGSQEKCTSMHNRAHNRNHGENGAC